MKSYLGGKGSNNLSISQFVFANRQSAITINLNYIFLYKTPAGASLQLVPQYYQTLIFIFPN